MTEPAVIYKYKDKNGTTVYDAMAPPTGTAYELRDGSGKVIDNGVIGQLSTKQAEARVKVKAIEDRVAKINAGRKVVYNSYLDAKKELEAAGAKTLAAGRGIEARRGNLLVLIAKTNDTARNVDAIQDQAGFALAGIGIIALIVLTAPAALIVGAGTAVLGQVNSATRSDEEESQLNDASGKLLDGMEVVNSAAEGVNLRAANFNRLANVTRATGLATPARAALGGVGSAAGFANAVVEAQGTTGRLIRAQIYSPEQLQAFRASLVGFEPTFLERLGGTTEGRADTLRILADDLDKAYVKYAEAEAEFYAKLKAYSDAIAAYVTYVGPK